MSELIKELKIVEDSENLFDTGNYVIPLYQRAYAWGDDQITQLIEDISDVAEDTNYYIGSLIVSKGEKAYEVVDGQQRLTSLYLLLNCLGMKVSQTLTFACREKSNYTLKHINKLINKNGDIPEEDKIEPNIRKGVEIIMGEFDKKDFDRDKFKKNLSHVILYRIEVPENTDLNRYFETMNTRGEQLEQHDILKAKLMSYLDEGDQNAFAVIWDACSDMNGYVQMHFNNKNNVRDSLFGNNNQDNIPPDNWEEYKTVINKELEDKCESGSTISDIIKKSNIDRDGDEHPDDNTKIRFESIIEFPYFLLHTLKVLVDVKGITFEDGSKHSISEQLDDKKLIDNFDEIIKNGIMDDKKISESKDEFSREFIICLIRTRYLFDKYIIKREVNEDSDGKWSLRSLDENNKMIQSSLRVTYTAPKSMHWITDLLKWLSKWFSEDNCRNKVVDPTVYSDFTEEIAQKAVKENFFNVCEKDNYAMGVNTPHIVFNYLDYLLWKNDREKYKDFKFEFRNSVEHWYPQNPSKGTFEPWEEVDRFGNLCIIQRVVNSRFSNSSPETKKGDYDEIIKKGSLKLREMEILTESNEKWKKENCEKHEKEMINILKEACKIQT